jgi:hypothetical protein
LGLGYAAHKSLKGRTATGARAGAKKKNDRIDAGKFADCLRCDFLPECRMAST